jgi:hypothetical protein
MTTSPLLVDLLQALDAPLARHGELTRYLNNEPPQAFLTPTSRRYLDASLIKMAVNVPRLVCESISERLVPNGFSDPRAWPLWTACDLDQTIGEAIFDSLAYGCGYVLVWARDGRPVASVEPADQCAVLRDPGTRGVVAGVKRFRTAKTTEVYVYLDYEVQHWRASSPGAGSGFNLVETIPHNLGMVPLVPIDNRRSEITDVLPLCDALNKCLLDLVIGSHTAGFGRRWATGVDLIEKPVIDDDGNPVLDGVTGEPVIEVTSPIDDLVTVPMAISEGVDTRFGSFSEPTLSGFETAVRVLVSQIMAVSSLPSHYLGVLTSQPSSADGLRASEQALVARCEQRQLVMGRALEQVARLLVAVDTGQKPSTIDMRVSWRPADSRSESQLSDSVTKLVQSNILPVSYALRKLGYSDDEIALIRQARRAEVLDGQGLGVQLGDQ